MTDDKTLFSEEEGLVSIDPEKDYFSELVGEDKRYKTPQEIARSKVEGDYHITRLERENRGLREELSSKTGMEQMLTELRNISQSGNPTEPNSSSSGESPGGEPNQASSGVTPENLEKKVAELVQAEREAARRSDNFNSVKEAVTSTWGPEAASKLKMVTEGLGLSQQEANRMAETNPKAFLRMIGVDKPAADPTPTQDVNNLFVQGDVNPARISPPNKPNTRNWDFYERMRKSENPQERANYWSKEVQVALHKDAQEQGRDFYTS